MFRAFRSARSRGNGGDEHFARNARCTVTTDLLCDIPTHKTTSPSWSAIFSLHTLASPSGRNVHKDEQLTEKKILSCSLCLYRFRKYVSNGFPTINCCNPGVHYEAPCIYKLLYMISNLFSLFTFYTTFFHSAPYAFTDCAIFPFHRLKKWFILLLTYSLPLRSLDSF